MAQAAKRKCDDDPDAEENQKSYFYLPSWVVSVDAFDLWQAGIKPPDDIGLSRGAADEVRRVRKWAALEKEKMQDPSDTALADLEREPIAQVPPEVLAPHHLPPVAVPAASQFDPAVLARVAQIMAASRVVT